MKLLFSSLVFILGWGVLSLAQAVGSASAPVAAVVPAVAPVVALHGLPAVIAFLKANMAAVALAVYAILDVAILISPKLDGNGLIHQLFIWAGKMSGQAPKPE